ncbi:hypothetical protein ACFE04_020935 [Oxalis oulophora]
MGSDKPGYARGHGIGVTKSKLTDFNTDLRKMRAESSSSKHSNALLTRIDNQDKVIANQNKMIANLEKLITEHGKMIDNIADSLKDMRSEIRVVNTAYDFFSGSGGGASRSGQHSMFPFTNNVEQVREDVNGHNASWKNQQDTYPLWRN